MGGPNTGMVLGNGELLVVSGVPPAPAQSAQQLQFVDHAQAAPGPLGLVGAPKDKLDQLPKPLQVKRVVKKCEHGRQKSQCKDCRGSGICEHNRQKRLCRDCGGSGLARTRASPCLARESCVIP
jgi:hypothetical protein